MSESKQTKNVSVSQVYPTSSMLIGVLMGNGMGLVIGPQLIEAGGLRGSFVAVAGSIFVCVGIIWIIVLQRSQKRNEP